jgi:hypothetical protein
MIVTFPLEVEQQVKDRAAQKGLDVASYLLSLVHKDTAVQSAFEQPNGNGDVDYDPAALNRAALREFQPTFELPPGMSAQDMWDSLKSDDRNDDDDPDALSRAIAELANRTPEQIEATRAEVMKAIPEPLPIPQGKTVFDMLFRIRGKETDEQVYADLERLS